MAEHAWFLPEPAGVPKGPSEGQRQPSTATYEPSVSKIALQRLTFSRIASAVAVQTNGFESSLCTAMDSWIAVTSSGTVLKTPRRMRWVVSSRNHRSTQFSQDELVGVKWR